jgi:CDP-diacylglycerol---glycerol-3-phosphate 3-phosphatidyltransferase
MITLPNLITLMRFPLALAFLQDNVVWRITALTLAMLSDALDGYIARRFGKISRLGTFLDPFADKLFVIFVLGIFLAENRLAPWEAATMLCRDFSVIIFGFYLAWKGTLNEYQFRAIWCGKVTTCIQFAVLFGLALRVSIPSQVFIFFIILGLLALIELYLSRTKLKVEG